MSPGKKPKFFYGYLIAATGFVIQGLGIGMWISYGVFFKPLANEFGWSRALVSGASSLAMFLTGLMGILVGRLNDKVGPRRIMTVTGVLLGSGYYLMSHVGAVWQIYLFYGVIIGLGFSSIDVVVLSTVARWFVRRRGFMTGIVKVGTGAGQLALPLLASVFITAYGWRNTYVIMGIALLILLVLLAQLLRRDPAQMGLSPDGDELGVSQVSALANRGLSLREASATRQLWLLCLANFIIVFCALTVMVHIVNHATDLGIPPTEAAGVLASIGGVSMVGRFMTGFAIDRIGSVRTTFICFILLIVSLLWLQVAKNAWMLYLFALVYGIAHGGFFTVISPIVAELLGIRSHGVLFGIVVFSGTIGGSCGPLLAGYIFDITESYRLAFIILIVLAVFGLVLTPFLKPVKELTWQK